MKKSSFKALLLATLVGALATRPADVLKELKLTQEEVSSQVFEQLTHDYPSLYLSYDSRQAAKQLSAQARATAVRAIYPIVRTYVESEDFRSRYDSWLRNKYHISDTPDPSATMTNADLKALMDEQLDQTLAAFSNLTPQLLAMMLPQQVAQLQEQMQGADAPTKAALNRELTELKHIQPLATSKPDEFKTRFLASMKRTMARQMEQGMKNEEEHLAKAKEQAEEQRGNEAKYQAEKNPNLVVQKKLREFIALAESVDFDAQTEKRGYRVEFVKDEHRGKSREWKQLYRIGREPVMAARDLARTWLKELQ
ncbi:hypothetical protein [Telluribacter sp. SYSU D00476]|uniref:hypothetical protein n=1 Tax=Telluribacter sp. SYSU D00476 TaxID=2811430 RepID=UPI001FF5339F|nr:hypothetical protein [Telluribacter sp. SYSU D00476]